VIGPAAVFGNPVLADQAAALVVRALRHLT
jgi:hypothetical protein